MSSSQPQQNHPVAITLQSPSASAMYAASVNPPRRAKLQAAASLLPALLPSPPISSVSTLVSNVSPDPESVQVQPKKKRGRKPASGASSRAAREAARKANHSRIEKARREKINNALQELKSLIPPDFAASVREGDGDEEEDEDDEESPVSPNGPSKKEFGKKTPSEREFKLDILERTVLFVRALLKRVDENGHSVSAESAKGISGSGCSCQCHSTAGDFTTKKRKVIEQEDGEQMKKRRIVDGKQGHTSDEEGAVDGSDSDGEDDNDATEDADTVVSSLSAPTVPKVGVRLPSISELLSSPVELGSAHMHTHTQQLPSPSLSPHFSPHFYGRNVRLAPSTSPPVLPQASVSRLIGTANEGSQSCEVQDGTLDSRVSCPVGMSYLLTPPSTDPTSLPSLHGTQAPAFRLPSSALSTKRKDAPTLEETKTSGLGNENDTDVDTEDGGARTATLALLQMREGSCSRVGPGRSASSSTTTTARTSLTPGGLLGIQTGGRS